MEQSLLGLLRGLYEFRPPDLEVLALLPPHFEWMLPEQSGFHILKAPFDSRNRWKRVPWEHLAMLRWVRAQGFQPHVFHSPTYILPTSCSLPTVLTCHDLIALDHPKLCTLQNRLYYRRFLPPSLRKADAIVAPSETIRRQIANRFPIPEERIHHIPHGLDPRYLTDVPPSAAAEVRQSYDLPDRYWLFLGHVEPKKNLENLLRGYALLKATGRRLPPLLVGGHLGWGRSAFEKTLAQLGLEKVVRPLGFIPPAHLPALYASADLFLFPSLAEGFGLPPVEAMACGTPVLVSDHGALPEVTGGLGIEVDPLNPESISVGMLAFLEENQPSLQNKGQVWARAFNWEKSVKTYSMVYSSVL